MKSSILSLFLLTSTLAWAQAPAPSTSPSPAKSSSPTEAPEQLRVRGPAAVAQQEPTRVVAVIDGQKITAEQALKMLKGMPANELQRFEQTSGGLTNALQQLFMMRHFADIAEQQHLGQQEPWKSQLEFYRENLMAQAYIGQVSNSAKPTAADLKNYYDQHPEDFQEAKLSAIFVGFTPPGAPKPAAGTPGARTEDAALSKANDLVKKIRGGADFAQTAQTESDNKPSAAKGGELGSFSPDKLPKEISGPVFKLKTGDITDPIRESNGFYILKVDNLNKKTFEQSQEEIVTTLKNEQVRKVLDTNSKQYAIQVQDPDFFNLPGKVGATTPSLAHPSSSAHPAPGQPKPGK
jgi:hypothetical protein